MGQRSEPVGTAVRSSSPSSASSASAVGVSSSKSPVTLRITEKSKFCEERTLSR